MSNLRHNREFFIQIYKVNVPYPYLLWSTEFRVKNFELFIFKLFLYEISSLEAILYGPARNECYLFCDRQTN